MNKFATLLAFVLLIAGHAALAASDGKGGIKKCQDATGRWHYGDTAAAACANSKITVINKHGVKKEEIDAPPTAEELKAREQQKSEAEQAEEQAKRDELLLATYGAEADITYIRDRKLAQLESTIKASTDTLVPLRATLERLEKQAAAEKKSGDISEQTAKALEQTRSQISKHEAAIAQRRREQEMIKAQAQVDLERYRDLKSAAAAEPQAGPAKR